MGSSITEAQKKRAQLRKNVTAQINSKNPYFVTALWNEGSFLMKTVRTYLSKVMRWVCVFNPHCARIFLSHEHLSTWIFIDEKRSCNERITHTGSKTISSSLYSDGTLRNDKIVMIISHWLQSIPKGSMMNFSRFSEDYIYYWCLNDWFSDNICHQINILSVPKSAKKKN